jgi:hypothetical protein
MVLREDRGRVGSRQPLFLAPDNCQGLFCVWMKSKRCLLWSTFKKYACKISRKKASCLEIAGFFGGLVEIVSDTFNQEIAHELAWKD